MIPLINIAPHDQGLIATVNVAGYAFNRQIWILDYLDLCTHG